MRFGIIGTNWITDKLLDAGSQIENFELTAVYSRTEEKAREFADKYNVKNIFTDLKEMAEFLGLGTVKVKDESYRFGLNAFKVLGGSYAIAKYIADEMNVDVSELPYSVLTSEEFAKKFKPATFFSATDGNHGRGVAWAANKLHQKSSSYLNRSHRKQ